MLTRNKEQSWGSFFVRIILPTLLAILLSVGSIYYVLIPFFERIFLENKREMIQELTSVAWGVLVLYENEEREGRLSRNEAQKQALIEIQGLRYGTEHKDYFWITDLYPRMLMHPYSPDLNGKDLTQYMDRNGKYVFVEMKELADQNGNGFLDYFWHAKYETQKNVSKLSFVRKFDGWGWVIGTGIFLDDVQEKIEYISNRLIATAIGFTIVLTLLLISINHQSLLIERKRRQANNKLSLSKEKYKKLAEASTHPTMMIFDGKCIYSNKTMCSLAGYSMEEFALLDPVALFPENHAGLETGVHYLNSSLKGDISSEQHRGLLQKKDGQCVDVLLRFSEITLDDKAAVVMIAKQSAQRKKGEELHQSNPEKDRTLLNRLNIGVIQTAPSSGFEIFSMNPVTRSLLHAQSEEEVIESRLLDWFDESLDGEEIEATLLEEGSIRDMVVPLKKGGDAMQVCSISMILTKDGKGDPLYCDVIIGDITEQKKSERERENLIVELQTSLLFLNQSIRHVIHGFCACDLHTSVERAAQIMSKAHQSSILVKSESGVMIGIVTDMAMRERVLAENLSLNIPVHEIMSSPLIYIEESALIFEAVLLMEERGVKHLVVKGASGEVVSVITNEELLHVHRYSTAFMIREISEATSLEEVFETQERVPRIVKALTDSGAHVKNITRIITTISDTILERLIDFAIEELGEPPVAFAFISLGSEGRGEQTLLTDQDNAIIYEDVADEEREAVQDYFNRFGEKVCTWLDQAGYTFCQGKIMAMNPEWCQPISTWKTYFTNWVLSSGPQDLLEVSIFFDFRCLYGDMKFTDDLREHVGALVETRAIFLQHLAKITLAFKAPVDFFGNIAVESAGEYANSFDIKYVIAAIVGFARVYSVKYGLSSTNTLQRLDLLLERNVLNKATYEEIVDTYNYLMQMRFRHQVNMINTGKKPDNFLNLDELSHMETIMIKKTFSQVGSFQKHLVNDFSVIT